MWKWIIGVVFFIVYFFLKIIVIAISADQNKEEKNE